MVALALGQFVVPLLVVDRDPHFIRIAEVQAFAAAVVLVAPVVLRVEHVGVVVKAFPVALLVSAAPHAAIGSLFGRRGAGRGAPQSAGGHQRENNSAEHPSSPLFKSLESIASSARGPHGPGQLWVCGLSVRSFSLRRHARVSCATLPAPFNRLRSG